MQGRLLPWFSENQVVREVPLPRSLMRDGGPPSRSCSVSGEGFAPAGPQCTGGGAQCGAPLAVGQKDKSLTWWNYPAAPEDEWRLVVDTETGLPVEPEMRCDRRHKIRRWVE